MLAVVFSFLYTFLYIKGFAICWLFAFLGSGLFAYLCFNRKIFAESALHIFYVLMAVYGFFNMSDEWQLNSWPATDHVYLILFGAIGMFASYWLLTKYTDSKLPLEDSFTTIFSVIATWVMVNYIHENYLYWIVIDAVSVHLYWKRQLYFGSALYAIYTCMVVAGYFGWM